ncbi:hypothetical protein MAR_026633 [Mya arenaria]|uniref:Uncharacterized protein n=1 Tax=Mya arenaria TaxID=6604 RepID=A0ABY7ER67_MYAAR|nr:hypothetical protein MAR_026633 [Mya arenaria]
MKIHEKQKQNEIYDKVQIQSKNEINNLGKIRAKVIDYLDRREKELLDNIKEVKTEDESLLAALKTEFVSTKARLEAMRTKMTSEDLSVNQRYVATRRAKKELRETEGKLEKMAGRLKARKIWFSMDTATWQLLESSTGLGRLNVSGEFRRENQFLLKVYTNNFCHSFDCMLKLVDDAGNNVVDDAVDERE